MHINVADQVQQFTSWPRCLYPSTSALNCAFPFPIATWRDGGAGEDTNNPGPGRLTHTCFIRTGQMGANNFRGEDHSTEPQKHKKGRHLLVMFTPCFSFAYHIHCFPTIFTIINLFSYLSFPLYNIIAF